MSKRIKALALMLAVAIVLAMMPVSDVKAGTFRTKISANQTIRHRLSDRNEPIWYEFTAPADGYFNVTIKKEEVSETGTYRVKLKNDLADKDFYNITGSSINSPVYPTKAGQKYYIVVEDEYGTKELWYKIKLNWHNHSYWENEPNDSQSTARAMAVNTTYYGIPSENDEGDYFYVKAPSNGYFVFDYAHHHVTESGAYDVEIYDAAAARITDMYGTSGKSIKVGVKAGTLLYVRVKNNGGGSKDQIYKLTPYFTASENIENEPNNSATQAKPIAFDQVYTGIIGNWNNDNETGDYYKFSVKSISQININLGPADISNTGYWKVILLNSKGKTAEVLSTNSNKTAKVKLAKGTYYIKVDNSYGAADKEYQLKVTAKNLKFKANRPVVRSASIKKYSNWTTYNNKKFVGCSLSKTVSGADGYEVSVASTKAMRKPFVKKKYETKGKKIKAEEYFKSSQKSFYVQVRPYFEDPFGTIVYGKKSIAKKVKTKAK